MSKIRTFFLWSAFALVVGVPVVIAAGSPLLQWRGPIYIAACFAGIIALALLFAQPLLAGGYMPGLRLMRARWLHAIVGAALVAALLIHVGGLWLTSPPDVVDALLFRSPTPFSVWGVIAMWTLLAAALLAAFRSRLHAWPRLFRRAHISLAAVTVAGTVAHAMLIEGTMGTVSKAVLCIFVVLATAKLIFDLRASLLPIRRRGS